MCRPGTAQGRSLREEDDMKRVSAVYRCRHCGEVYKAGEYSAENLRTSPTPNGWYRGERVVAYPMAAALYDIHACDACCPKLGLADLMGWE